MIEARQILLPPRHGSAQVEDRATRQRAHPVEYQAVVRLAASLMVGPDAGDGVLDPERFVPVPGPAAIEPVARRDVVIDARRVVMEVEEAGVRRQHEIALPIGRARRGRVGIRVQGGNLGRRRVDAIAGNAVARERVAHPVGAFLAARGRVINRHQPAGVVEGAGEIALLLQDGRHRRNGLVGKVQILVVGLAREEEKCTVLAVVDLRNAHRAPDGEAPLIEAGLLPPEALGIVRERVGVQRRPLQKLVGAAVIAAGAALGGDVDHSAARSPVLGIVDGGHHFELFHRVGRRHISDTIRAAGEGVVRCAVHDELGIVIEAAIH